MARMLGYNGITVISADPGPCYTDLTKQAEQESMVLHIFMAIWRTCFMRSTEVGSRTVVKAALVKDKENYHGRYMTLGEIEDDGQYANSQQGKELEVKLWVSVDIYFFVHAFTNNTPAGRNGHFASNSRAEGIESRTRLSHFMSCINSNTLSLGVQISTQFPLLVVRG